MQGAPSCPGAGEVRPAAGRVNMQPMAGALHFTSIAGQRSWQVHQDGPAGRLLGSVLAQNGGYQATHVAPGGKLMLHWSADRDAAAAWLLRVAPQMTR